MDKEKDLTPADSDLGLQILQELATDMEKTLDLQHPG